VNSASPNFLSAEVKLQKEESMLLSGSLEGRENSSEKSRAVEETRLDRGSQDLFLQSSLRGGKNIPRQII